MHADTPAARVPEVIHSLTHAHAEVNTRVEVQQTKAPTATAEISRSVSDIPSAPVASAQQISGSKEDASSIASLRLEFFTFPPDSGTRQLEYNVPPPYTHTMHHNYTSASPLSPAHAAAAVVRDRRTADMFRRGDSGFHDQEPASAAIAARYVPQRPPALAEPSCIAAPAGEHRDAKPTEGVEEKRCPVAHRRKKVKLASMNNISGGDGDRGVFTRPEAKANSERDNADVRSGAGVTQHAEPTWGSRGVRRGVTSVPTMTTGRGGGSTSDCTARERTARAFLTTLASEAIAATDAAIAATRAATTATFEASEAAVFAFNAAHQLSAAHAIQSQSEMDTETFRRKMREAYADRHDNYIDEETYVVICARLVALRYPF